MICKNCQFEVDQNYCPNCGQPSEIKRIDGLYIMHEIGEVLNFERGILYTIKELLTRPGDNIRHFIFANRSRLVKPIIYIIVTSLIYTLVSEFLAIEDGYVNFEEGAASTTGAIFAWVQSHYGYANIIMGVYIAVWAKVFFWKYDYNFFEVLILLCFVMGTGMLIFAFFAILQGLTNVDLMQIAGIAGIIYCSWAIGQFFDKRRPISYLKALAAYFLGMATSALFAVGIGSLIDILMKQ